MAALYFKAPKEVCSLLGTNMYANIITFLKLKNTPTKNNYDTLFWMSPLAFSHCNYNGIHAHWLNVFVILLLERIQIESQA